MCRLGLSEAIRAASKNLAAGDPEHVGVQFGKWFVSGHQEIQRDHIGSVAMAQFAWDVAVHAAIVHVVAAPRQHDPRFAALFQ